MLKIETQSFSTKNHVHSKHGKTQCCWRQKATVSIISFQFGGMSQPRVFQVVNQCYLHVITHLSSLSMLSSTEPLFCYLSGLTQFKKCGKGFILVCKKTVTEAFL